MCLSSIHLFSDKSNRDLVKIYSGGECAEQTYAADSIGYRRVIIIGVGDVERADYKEKCVD